MKISLKVLGKILQDAEFHNLLDDEQFEIFNVANLKDFDKFPSNSKTLYFLVYEDNPEDLGWYKKPFDRSQNLAPLKSFTNMVFAADSRVSDEQLKGCKYIRVKNIHQVIDTIREYVVSSVKPMIVGVTGSVGKTTCTALTENVLLQKFSCGRIYSKRLTPLILSSWLANFLLPSHQVVVLEYSMYRKHHIGDLIQLLKPNIGVFLNLKRMHLGVPGIDTIRDILDSKAELVNKSDVGILNADDSHILSLRRKNDLIFSCENPKADAFVRSDKSTTYLHLNYANQVIPFNPYVRTKLFYHQIAVAGLVGSVLGVSANQISYAINNFIPAENRIQWIKVLGENVLFDGDVTISSRFSALAENDYKTSILLIHSFDFGEENVFLQIDDFNQTFSSFTEVRILDTNENRDAVSRYSFKNILFFPRNKFFENLNRYRFKVLHFGIYHRKHKDLQCLLNFLSA